MTDCLLPAQSIEDLCEFIYQFFIIFHSAAHTQQAFYLTVDKQFMSGISSAETNIMIPYCHAFYFGQRNNARLRNSDKTAEKRILTRPCP